jgi:taurine--2-oxoglutarate transaminase
VRNRQTRAPLAAFNHSSPEMKSLQDFLDEHGVYLHTHWNTVLLIPPLIITEEQLVEGLDLIDKALEITDQAVI